MNPYQPGEDNQDPYEVGYKAGAASRAEQIASLKDELRQISTAIDDVRLDLTNTAAELIMEMKEQLASRDAEIAELKEQRDASYKIADHYRAERDQLRNELETERMRNVACGVVAMADTPDSAKQARDMHPDYMSAACSDVARRVDECIKLREQVKMLLDELLRVKVVCLREFGIGVVNENVLSATRE